MAREKTTKKGAVPWGLENSGAKICLGVTGGISAYKAVDLASKLTSAGAAVRVVMTESACELIRPRSFEAVTASAVYTSLWDGSADDKIVHIRLADWADLMAVAPATANIIGKVANGTCDDLLSTLLCVMWEKPILLAPAMNEKMWKNPVVRDNIKKLKNRGLKFVGPRKGRLACGTDGIGRMSEPEEIMEAIERVVSKRSRKSKEGQSDQKHLLQSKGKRGTSLSNYRRRYERIYRPGTIYQQCKQRQDGLRPSAGGVKGGT